MANCNACRFFNISECLRQDEVMELYGEEQLMQWIGYPEDPNNCRYFVPKTKPTSAKTNDQLRVKIADLVKIAGIDPMDADPGKAAREADRAKRIKDYEARLEADRIDRERLEAERLARIKARETETQQKAFDLNQKLSKPNEPTI